MYREYLSKQKGHGKKKTHVGRNLSGYTGPYPYSMLNDARHLLMRTTDMRDKAVWQRIRLKTGILNPIGDGDETFNGWGEASTYFSHADLFEENSMEGNYGLYGSRLPSNASTSAMPSATATSADVKMEGDIELMLENSNNSNSSGSGTTADNIDDEMDNRTEIDQGFFSKPSKHKENNVVEITVTSEVLVNNDGKTTKEQKSDYKENRKTDTQMKSAFNKKTMRPSGSGHETTLVKAKRSTPEEGEIIEINTDDSDDVVEFLSDDNEVEITGEEKVNFDPIVTSNMVSRGQDVDIESSWWKPDILVEIDSGKEDEDLMIIDSSETGKVPFINDKVSSKKVSNSVLKTKKNMGDKSQIQKCIDLVPGVLIDFPLVEVYKCDFCSQICETQTSMKEHLNSVCHFSASKIHVDQGNNTIQVIEKLAIMVKEHLYKKAVAICPHPMCKKIFTTIYTCSLHHRLKHDVFGRLVYGIASVESESEFINPSFSLACPVCKEKRYLKKKNKKNPANRSKSWASWFIQHYETKNHYPFDYTKGDCHFVCPECREIFQDLHQAMVHEVSHHTLAMSHDIKLTVIQTGKIEVLELPEKTETIATMNAKAKAVDSKNCTESVKSIPIGSSAPSKSSAMSIPDTNLFFIDREPASAYNPSESQSSVQASHPNTAHCGHGTGASQPYTALGGHGTGASQSNTALGGHGTGALQPNTAHCGHGTGDRKQAGIGNSNGIASTVVSQPFKDGQDNMFIDAVEVKDEVIIEENQFIKTQLLCDYCKKCDLNKDEIYHHLINECHSSASTVQVCNNNTPNFMLKPMSVLNYRADYKQMVAACPSEGCSKIFPDIFQCNVHCNVYHASFGNVYGVADIHKSVEVKLTVDAFCYTCKCSFRNRNLLNKHLKDKNHFPEECKDLCPTMSMHFVCVYCEKDVNTYTRAANHIIKKHNMKAIKGNFRVRVIHRNKEVYTRNMLPFPFNRFGEIANLRNSWESMAKLKKEMGKHSRKDVEIRRKKLKEIGRAMEPQVDLNFRKLKPNREVTRGKGGALKVFRENTSPLKRKKKNRKERERTKSNKEFFLL